MSPLALVLCACALAAPLHAASLPPSLPQASLPAEQEQIPVVLVRDDPVPETKLNEIENEEIQRPALESSIKESIERTRDMLTQSLKETSLVFQKWLSDGDDQIDIKKSIQSMRNTFNDEIGKLRNTMYTQMRPEETVQTPEGSKRVDMIESKLTNLENDFNKGMQTLLAGIEVDSFVKSSADEDENVGEATEESSEAPTGAETSTAAPTNAWNQFWQIFSESVVLNFNSLIGAFQPQPPSSSVQSDTPTQIMQSPFRPPILINALIQAIAGTISNIGSSAGGSSTGGSTSAGSSETDPSMAGSSETDPSMAGSSETDPSMAGSSEPAYATNDEPDKLDQPVAADNPSADEKPAIVAADPVPVNHSAQIDGPSGDSDEQPDDVKEPIKDEIMIAAEADRKPDQQGREQGRLFKSYR